MTPPSSRLPLLALWLAGLALFVLMATLAAAHDTFPGDVWFTERLQSVHSGALERVLDRTSDMAVTPRLAVVAGLAALIFLAFRRPVAAGLVVCAFVLRGLDPILKDMVERPRPSPDTVFVRHQLGDLSFPSGHAFNAMVVYGLLLYLVTAHVKNVVWRTVLQFTCAWIVVMTGVQRVYFGFHWASDVIGGFLAAGLVVGVLVAVHVAAERSQLLQRRLHREAARG